MPPVPASASTVTRLLSEAIRVPPYVHQGHEMRLVSRKTEFFEDHSSTIRVFPMPFESITKELLIAYQNL